MTITRIPLTVAYRSPIVSYSDAVEHASKLTLDELVRDVRRKDNYSRIAFDAIIMKNVDHIIAESLAESAR